MTMKLITEMSDTVATLVEATESGSKKWYIEGVYLQSDLENRNKRMYPREIMEREVNRYVNDYVNKNRAVGELGHPDGPTINLDRVSHRITELRQEGTNFVGKAQILDTPMGKIAQNLLEGGVSFGVSSRGMGSLQKNSKGIMEVQGDFYLATAGDIVFDPSAPDAWVNGIMEGVEFYWDGGRIEKKMVAAREVVEQHVRSRTLDDGKKLEIMERFIRSI